MLYRLDEYVAWLPLGFRDPARSKKIDKFWADLWEAWWACLFWEREIWGDGVEDLISCLRRIMSLKYHGLIEMYCTQPSLDRETNDTGLRLTKKDIKVKEYEEEVRI